MLPAVLALTSGTLLLAGRDDTTAPIVPAAPLTDLEVPLNGLTRKQWLAFVHVAICGKANTIGKNYRLGIFGLSVPRLSDLGVLEDCQAVGWGKSRAWDGKWKDPKSLHDFQAQPMLQYELFARSVKEYADDQALRANVNRSIDGQSISLSGLLMLAQRAGLAGMERWIGSSEVRERHRDNTTAFVKRANGIF